MKKLLITGLLSVAVSGNALAAQTADACKAEEGRLRAEEGLACSGARYFFNPSACYKAQRLLKQFAEGSCSKYVAAQPAIAAPDRPAAPQPVQPIAARSTLRVMSSARPSEIELLKAEVRRLRSEVEQLKLRCK